MKSNQSFQQEGYAPDPGTEPQADIFSTLKPPCSPKKRLAQGDLWMIHKGYGRRPITNGIRYRF